MRSDQSHQQPGTEGRARLSGNLRAGPGGGFPGKAVPVLEPLKTLLKKHLCLCFRIAGDTALNKNIHESVSAQIRKNFAKSKWRVSVMSIRSP